MRLASRHIATLLLACFLIGGLLVPTLHQIQHGLDAIAQGTPGALHEHPDFDALSDDSPHLNDKDLACVLCSITLFGGTIDALLAALPDVEALQSDRSDQYLVIHGSLLPIRGPPATC